ncbi:MAG: hypothetical protein ACRDYX_02505 [Egibacteraceae bacterium]
MSSNRALVIAATLMTLMTLTPPAYADPPVTADDCIQGGGVVFTDANGSRACSGGTFDGRFVV